MNPRVLFGCVALLLVGSTSGAAIAQTAASPAANAQTETTTYRPQLKVPESEEPFLRHVAPGDDAFPEERVAADLAARLDEWGRRLQANPARAGQDATELLLAPEFKGGHLVPSAATTIAGSPSLQIRRAHTLASGGSLDRRAFESELGKFVEGLQSVHVAEFMITAIDVKRDTGLVRTEVRYDIVGAGTDAWRAERNGRWEMRWLRAGDGTWRVASWSAMDGVTSSAAAPIFTEITTQALAGDSASWHQLSAPLDAWLATIDSVLARDSIGHHGVAIGDADGDGRDDLYVAQPAGLPNRLLRAVGGGRFEDATETAGVGVLDGTSQALFADVDNDGDQDLVLATDMGLLLFANDGHGHFTQVPDAFHFKSPLEGAPTSIAMADYDRDGFLDLYLCAYVSFIGVSEDRAGPPAPYYDAHNGPSNVLFHNDGHGRFFDVTKDVGLDVHNDRFTYAAAWGDYDGDGWPDLLVANDFGRKNLYRNLGRGGGTLRFEDVAARAGVEDFGAGMSAAFFDYDNDGRLDLYTGNMWTAAGQRITAQAAFMPTAPPEVRAAYQRHARGNSLFKNRGDGTFEDATLASHSEMGRWAWSSDALDFDSDGWQDLYVVNGMITRDKAETPLDSFFWRQVVARSPLTRIKGTSYDESWRALNRLLADGSQAAHERNVFLRNDGHGVFDDVSGTVGLDLDQDGRAFAVFDYDGDGDPDVAVMAARGTPQLRLFRNDFTPRGVALALRLTGNRSNRDAIGARVTVDTGSLRVTRVVQAGSGFLSQSSKELLFGLGAAPPTVELTINWPSGLVQQLSGVPIERRVRVTEGDDKFVAEPFERNTSNPSSAPSATTATPRAARSNWLYEPFPAPELSARGLGGEVHSLAELRGRPALLLFWSTSATLSRATLDTLSDHAEALSHAGLGLLSVTVDDEARVRSALAGRAPASVALGNEAVAGNYAILMHYLFTGEAALEFPTAFLLDAQGQIVKVYRDSLAVPELLADVSKIETAPAERLARALPFHGHLYSPPGGRNYLYYGRELVEQGSEALALVAFERAAQGQPSASTLYTLGSLFAKSGQNAKARSAFERALALKPDFAEASNDLGALLAQSGDVPGAIARFRAALEATPDYPDALNNLGYALLLTNHEDEALGLYRKALALQPDFAEALNNVGLLLARGGDIAQAETYFRRALLARPKYSEAGNNLALALVARGQTEIAVRTLERVVELDPSFENAYVTLAKIYLTTDRTREGVQALEQLLQRNPQHPLALELLRQFKSR